MNGDNPNIFQQPKRLMNLNPPSSPQENSAFHGVLRLLVRDFIPQIVNVTQLEETDQRRRSLCAFDQSSMSDG
jgi:hypothetical protein